MLLNSRCYYAGVLPVCCGNVFLITPLVAQNCFSFGLVVFSFFVLHSISLDGESAGDKDDDCDGLSVIYCDT
jgi:hypothetical protein